MPAPLDPGSLDLDVRNAPPGRPGALLPLNHLHLGRLTIVVLVLGIVWRVIHYTLAFPIWGDEGFVAINFLVLNATDMLGPLKWGQIVPAGFMWIGLATTKLLGTSEWALRLPSFVFGIASLLLFFRFARRVLPLPAAALAIGILAAAYYPVRHATEVKPYALDMLVSLGLSMMAWSVYERPASRRCWIALVVLGAVAPWLSYPSAFVGGGVGLLLTMLLVRQRFDSTIAIGWACFGLALVASFAAMYQVYGSAQADFGSRLVEIEMWRKAFPPSLVHPIEFIKWMVWVHTGNLLAYPVGADRGGSTATFLLVCIGAARMWRCNRPLLVLLLAPLGLAFIAGALQRYPYGASARTSLYMAPAFCLLAGLGLWRVIAWGARGAFSVRGVRVGGKSIWVEWGRGPLVRLAVCALIVLATGGSIYSFRARGSDSPEQRTRDAVTQIRDRTNPGDRWVVFNAIEPVPYAPYLGDWKGTGGQFVFDLTRFAPVPVSWAPAAESISATGKTWVFTYRGVKVAFPEEQFAAYRDAIAARLGPPSTESYVIKIRDARLESIELSIFSASATAGE